MLWPFGVEYSYQNEGGIMYSYISHLECSVCEKEFPHNQVSSISECCAKVLFARYDLQKLKKEVDKSVYDSRESNMWRFSELLPVTDPSNVVTLGEGGTPLLRTTELGKKLSLNNLYIKDEGLNPTGTFKARGIGAAVSKANELGVKGFTMPSAGNAAGAVAAYAARSGHPVKVYMPQDAPSANKKESLLTGAELNLVDGLISDAGRISSQVAKEENLFDLSTLKEPYRAEGKKTMALELAQQLGWKIPDVIVYPTGGGTGIIGMHKGFNELLELGWVTGKQPRFIAVQAEGCQPIVKAFNEGADSSEMWTNAATVADGLRVPGPFADYVILKILRETGGTALSVTDKEMVDAMYEISSDEGVVICPEGAATLVGLRQLLNNGLVSQDETVILLNTGSAYKYLELVSET